MNFFSRRLKITTGVFAMSDLKEQCVAVKYCLVLVKTVAKPLDILQTAYKENAMTKSQRYE